MTRLLLCIAASLALTSCAVTARTVRHVCNYSDYDTSYTVRFIQRNYTATELDIARDVLETRDPRQPTCWGRAGLVLAVLASEEEFPLLRDSVEAMARIDEREIRTATDADLLLAVGIAARFTRNEASKAAIVEYLAQLSEPAWWMARSHSRGSAISRSGITLAALSQTASHQADQLFAGLLRDEQLEARLGYTIRSYVEGLKRANRKRMAEDGLGMPPEVPEEALPEEVLPEP
ncbi:MAG: hypothetical protein H6701_05350 [Myxococcales bacterium]|nr:hypothetical protein [Myxococcales bacterium]